MKTKIPRVTEVIKAAGIGPDFSFVNEEQLSLKSRLGTDVHRLCASWPRFGRKGKLPDSPAMDYARQFRAWIQKTGAVVLRSEFTVKGTIKGFPYIGHPDLLMKWHDDIWVIDLKTVGQLHQSHGVQTALYLEGCWQMGIIKAHTGKRGILWLSPTACKLISGPPIIRPLDFEAGRAAVIISAWKRNVA